jgi:hypothetical protein
VAKIPRPQHFLRMLDEQGNMTPEFYRLLLAIINKLNSLPD